MGGNHRRSAATAAGAVAACCGLAAGLLVAPVAGAAAAPGGRGGVSIHDIQGVTRLSPFDGRRVSGVSGVVTGVRETGSRGFWIQDPRPDGDPRTSEGLFVHTGDSVPRVSPGDVVSASGTVGEYYPLGWDESPETTANQSLTELTGATWRVTGRAPVPAARTLRPSTVPQEYAPDAAGGNIEKLALEPERYALDFYESREGMNLRVEDARVVGATDEYGGLWVTTKPLQNANERGGTTYTSYAEPNSGRLKVESLIPAGERPFPDADVGDRLRGATAGPLDYSRFGGYVLQARKLGEHVDGGLQRESTRPQAPGELGVATYNVENLAATDGQEKFDRLAQGIVANLAAPDIVSLEEVQDNNGDTDNGVVAADGTLRRLTDAIVAAGGPRYQWRQISPRDKADGGEPGGNIRVAFLFDPARVSFVDRSGGDATTPVRVVERSGSEGDSTASLSVSPGRIEPRNPAFDDSRKPLIGEFTFRGKTVFVVANHFNSKGGDQPLHGRFQPPERSSEQQRTAQAEVVRGFVEELRAVDPDARILVVGDLNDFGFSPALDVLTSGGLRDLSRQLPPVERYSYVYDGNSQLLDHMLVSPSIREVDYDIVHGNAEFTDQVSDHDPQVARIGLGRAGCARGGSRGPEGNPAADRCGR